MAGISEQESMQVDIKSRKSDNCSGKKYKLSDLATIPKLSLDNKSGPDEGTETKVPSCEGVEPATGGRRPRDPDMGVERQKWYSWINRPNTGEVAIW